MDENKSFVIQNLDESNLFIKVTKLLFCINLIFSYPLTIYPANKILEGFLFVRMTENTPTRKWLKNLSRFLVCVVSAACSILTKNVNYFRIIFVSKFDISNPFYLKLEIALTSLRSERDENVKFCTKIFQFFLNFAEYGRADT